MWNRRARIGALLAVAAIVAVAGGTPAPAQEQQDGAAPAQEQDGAAPADAPPDPPKVWQARFAAGMSLREGDESSFSASGDAMLKRLWESDTLTFRALGDYGESDGDVDTNNFGANLAWRHDFHNRYFWLSNAGADHDAVQGRNLRVIVNSGPGYRIWEAAEDRFFDVSSGLGYRHEEFNRDEPDNDLIDVRVGYEYDDKYGEVVELVHKTDAYAPVNDIENFLLTSELTLSMPLVGGLHFRNSARYEYVNEPVEDNEEHNFWLTLGLEYRL